MARRILPTLMLPRRMGGNVIRYRTPRVLPDTLRKKYPSIPPSKVMLSLTQRLLFDSSCPKKGLTRNDPENRWMIDPLAGGSAGLSVVYYTKDTKRSSVAIFASLKAYQTPSRRQTSKKSSLRRRTLLPLNRVAVNSNIPIGCRCNGRIRRFHGGKNRRSSVR